jgi:hypothetical protein
MKPVLICFAVLTCFSLWFGAQGTPPITCRGKQLSITIFPGRKMTGSSLPLRFGGTRQLPFLQFPSDKSLRLVIKNRDEFNNFWKQLNSRVVSGQSSPPEIDFSKEMIVVVAMGERPTSGYWTYIDGACEVDGQVEVFVSTVEGGGKCGAVFTVLTYPADAVRLPRTDLPIVFRETQISCAQWQNQLQRLK